MILSEYEIAEIGQELAAANNVSDIDFARAIEALIEKKLGEQEPVAWLQTSVEEGVDTALCRMHKPKKFNADWWRFDPLFTHSAPSIPEGWQPIETAPKDGISRLYACNGYVVQGFVDATGTLMVQSEIYPHWRKMRYLPSHWMPLPAAAPKVTR